MSACPPGSSPIVTPRALETRRKSPASSPPIRRGAENAQKPPASTASRSTAPTATCSTSSCRTAATSRTDAYGGPIENRARLMLEVADAVHRRLGRRPRRHAPRAARRRRTSMGDCDPAATFGYVAARAGPPQDRLPVRPRAVWRRPRLGPAAEGDFRRPGDRQRGASPRRRRSSAGRRAKPTRWRSASCSSPTPTCRAASPRRAAQRARSGDLLRQRPAGYTDYPALDAVTTCRHQIPGAGRRGASGIEESEEESKERKRESRRTQRKHEGHEEKIMARSSAHAANCRLAGGNRRRILLFVSFVFPLCPSCPRLPCSLSSLTPEARRHCARQLHDRR